MHSAVILFSDMGAYDTSLPFRCNSIFVNRDVTEIKKRMNC